MTLVALLGAPAAALLATAEPAIAVGTYSNAAIADEALTHVGEDGGQCRAFVNSVVGTVSGGSQNLTVGSSDYFSSFTREGGIEITSIDSLVKGDIVQIGQYGTDPNLHTFIIVSRVSGSTFNVVDSNHSYDEVVQNYNRTVSLDGNRKAFRMGTVGGTYQGIQHIYSGTSAGTTYESYWGGGNTLTTAQKSSVGSAVTAVSVRYHSNVTSIYYGTSSGEVYETYWGGGNTLTTWQLASLGSAVTSIDSVITADGTQHVYTGMASGTLHETYWGGGNSLTTWQIANVGSPVRSISYQLTSNGVQHVFSGADDGKIWESYWGGGNTLTTYTLATLTGGVTSIESLYTSDGVAHVYTGTTAARIYETYWGGGNTLTTAQKWVFGSSVAAITVQIYNGVTHIYSGLSDGTVHETYWGGGNTLTTWQVASLGSAIQGIITTIT